MAVFPLTKKPRQDRYQDMPGDSSIKTPVSQGRPKKRLLFTEGINYFSPSYDVTTAEVATLKTFFKTTTSSGTVEFEWDDPATGSTLDVMFDGPPVFIPNGAEWVAHCRIYEVPS